MSSLEAVSDIVSKHATRPSETRFRGLSLVIRVVLFSLLMTALDLNAVQAEDAPSPATIARLVADLASDSRAVRTQAELSLIALGSPVVEHLPSSSASDPAVRDSLDRIVRAIEKAESETALTPKSATWTAALPLRQAIEQLTAATGNPLPVPPLDDVKPTEPLPSQPLTFWEAIDWLELHTTLRYEAGQLRIDPARSPSPASLSGPFRIQLLNSSSRTTAGGTRLLGIKLRTTCEPRLRPLFLMSGVDDWTVSHASLTASPFTPHARREIPSGKSGESDVTFDFVVPESVTEAADWTLQGHIDLTLSAHSTTVTFRDLAARLPLTRRRGQASLSLLSIKPDESGLSVRIASAFPEMRGLFESYRASLLAPTLTLELSTGERLASTSVTQIQEDPNGLILETRFNTTHTTGSRLHSQVPIAISTQKIPFEFSKVALLNDANVSQAQ